MTSYREDCKGRQPRRGDTAPDAARVSGDRLGNWNVFRISASQRTDPHLCELRTPSPKMLVWSGCLDLFSGSLFLYFLLDASTKENVATHSQRLPKAPASASGS